MAATGSYSLLYLTFLLSLPVRECWTLQSPGPYTKEVNLLSESLLQIGTGLRKEVNFTKTQIRSIFQQLHQFNSSLVKLTEQIKQASKLGEELDAKAKSFEDNEKMYEALAVISEELVKLQKEGKSLDNIITPLEKKVQAALDMKEERESSVNTTEILSVIEKQNMQIDILQTIVDNHQNHINSQEAKIRRLLRKAGIKNLKAKRRRNLRLQEKNKDTHICQTQN